MRPEQEREELVMTLMELALEQPADCRQSYLRNACGDEAVRAEVEERIEWEERMGDFLREPLTDAFELLCHPFSSGEDVAGRFRIVREVGRGGMGVVYEAFDRKLNRHIALKTARPGYRDRLPPEVRAATAVSHFNDVKCMICMRQIPPPAKLNSSVWNSSRVKP